MPNTTSLKVDGTCYRLHGDPQTQPVLVLIHGVGLDQSMWESWRRMHQGRYCILTYDLLGHGESDNPAGERTLENFADQLDALVGALSLSRWHLVGFSLGALVAVCYAAREKHNGSRYQGPASLTLLHSVYDRSPLQRRAIEQRYVITRDQGPMATVEAAIERWFSAQWIAAESVSVDLLRGIFRRHTGDGYLKAYRLFCDADQVVSTLDLDLADLPARVITGDLDTGSTPDMAARLSARLNAELTVNPGHRHMAPVEHAEQLSSQVMAFIDSLS